MRRRWLLISAVLPALAVGGENRWQGGDPKRPTDWHAAANWSLRVVPGEADGRDAVVASGTVRVMQDAAVGGRLVLAGGHVVVAPGKVLTVRGDLVFRGKGPGACLTPNGEVRLHGTITSDGSSRYLVPAAGWVAMVGKGNQAIVPGGLLPPIRLRKPSGKVTPAGDLHCAGMCVERGNTLDLSRGQRLSLATPQREWHFDPKDKLIVKTYVPFRSSRDLVNRGTVLGGPFVPFTLYVSAGDKAYAVSGRYEAPRRVSESPAAGRLSINAPDSRLVLREGKLTLDGKPAPAGGLPDLEDLAPGRARITHLSVREVPSPKVSTSSLVNVAPYASHLRSSPSIGHDIWNVVDGSPATAASFRSGVGRGGTYELIFAEPVTVSAVRLRQGRLFAIRYTLRADTDGDGRYETTLVHAAGGSPNAWREHAFAPTTLRGLELRGLDGQRGWEQSYPQIHELEVYADAASLARVRRGATTQPAIGRRAKWLTAGAASPAPPPAAEPRGRILKGVMVDLWMFGIHDERQLTFAHIRDYEPFRKLLAGVKDLGADTVTLFVEADPQVFWPSRNFKSLTNRKYFRELARRMHVEHPEGAETQRPAIDPPVKKDVLREFCEAMHAGGIKVLVLFLGRVMANYVGPPRADAWVTLCEEVAARGADGVYVCGDEEWFGLANPKGASLPADHPDRLAFKKRWGPDSDLPKGWEHTANYRKHVLLNYERAALALRRRRDAVKKINPRCLTLINVGSHGVTANNRMTYGVAYDILGHIAGLDYFGTDYVPQETRTFVAAAGNRQATMVLGAGEPVGSAVSCIMQGARVINYYRYNYIALWKATARRKAGFRLIRSLEDRGIADGRTPRKIALLLSRASEDWWDNANGTFWLGGSDEAKRGFWTSRLVNELLLRRGYPFDLYYLDQPDDLRAIGDYKLLIVPFPYSIGRGAAAALRKALAGGTRMLIAQRRGEVDEYGVPYDKPILGGLIDEGVRQRRVIYLDWDLVAREVERTFDDGMSRAIDGLLGADRPLTFRRRGHRVEAHLVEKHPREQFLALINRGGPAAVEAGLHLPAGSYAASVLSSTAPAEARVARIAGRAALTEKDLAGFAVRLDKEEVKVLHVTPAGR